MDGAGAGSQQFQLIQQVIRFDSHIIRTCVRKYRNLTGTVILQVHGIICKMGTPSLLKLNFIFTFLNFLKLTTKQIVIIFDNCRYIPCLTNQRDDYNLCFAHWNIDKIMFPNCINTKLSCSGQIIFFRKGLVVQRDILGCLMKVFKILRSQFFAPARE